MLRLLEKKTDSAAFICSLDEAIGAGSNWTEYRKLLDESHLVFVGEPTRFHVRPLTASQKSLATDHSAGAEAFFRELASSGSVPMSYMREAARYAVSAVDNPDPSWPKPVIVRERGYAILSREVLDGLPDLVCIELALLATELEHGLEKLKKK